MKRIIICCDGTWNTPEAEDHGHPSPTNVAKMAELISPIDNKGVTQITYYQRGVGTGTASDKIVGGAFGVGLSRNIGDAYRFLVSNYVPEDEIWLFGFSRGAYTARSIIGLINNSGLLKKSHMEQFHVAYELYRDRSELTSPKSNVAESFKKDFSHIPTIHFLGVWDTVGSLGVPDFVLSRFLDHKWDFHDLTLSNNVHSAFHALSIDEKRGDFKPCMWEGLNTPNRQQVWFPGAHSDVGGGYPDTGLSDCSLIWMMDKAEACGLYLDKKNVDMKPNFRADPHDSKTGFFMLRPGYLRTISPQTIFQSAIARKENADLKYKPTNWPVDNDEQSCPSQLFCPHPCR